MHHLLTATASCRKYRTRLDARMGFIKGRFTFKVKSPSSLYFKEGKLSDDTSHESIKAVSREFELFNYI